MTFILCLAHYCDIHGPTPLMVTEGLPSDCSTCFAEPSSPRAAGPVRPQPSTEPKSNSQHTPSTVTDALRDLSIARSVSGSAPEQGASARRATIGRSSITGSSATTGVLDTPPGSPSQPPPINRDSSYRRTYDETVTKKQGPCDNCAMTLPPRQSTMSKSQGADQPTNSQPPPLRTRYPASLALGRGDKHTSPPNSQSSSETDGDEESLGRSRFRKETPSASSRTTSCSSTSSSSDRPATHIHYVDYTSTHEPMLANSFSLVRSSCLQFMSIELPPNAQFFAPASPAYVTTHSAGIAVSGGPMFFGDQMGGYTTAYQFRISDVHARGHKRAYAFLAMSTHKERVVMKSFNLIGAAFQELAAWIQQMAEAEAERVAEKSTSSGDNHSVYAQPGHAGGHRSQHSRSAFGGAPTNRGGSSFLTGGGSSGLTRRMAGGPGASGPKARGLAELVGQPDFFIQLHGKFVHLLLEIGLTIGS